MKLLRKLGLCLMPCVLVLSACVTVPTQDNSPRHQASNDQDGMNDVYCNATKDGFCRFGSINHRPVRMGEPKVSVRGQRSVMETGKCLVNHLQTQFKLPPEFLQVVNYPNGTQAIAMINPFTHIKGIQIDVVNRGLNNSQINLYANNMELSKAWLTLPNLCR